MRSGSLSRTSDSVLGGGESVGFQAGRIGDEPGSVSRLEGLRCVQLHGWDTGDVIQAGRYDLLGEMSWQRWKKMLTFASRAHPRVVTLFAKKVERTTATFISIKGL